MSRGQRIHHAQRIKAKRSNYYRGVHAGDARRIGMLVNTATVCSCFMCGNPRRHFGGPPIQERSNLELCRLSW